jgi:hypothetical protein
MTASPAFASPSDDSLLLVGETPREAWYVHLLVLTGFLLVGVLFTWPLVLHWQSGTIQKGTLPVDAGQGIWNLWWAYQSLSNGQLPYVTRYLFFPETVDLFWQPLNLPNALLVFPVLAYAGPIAAFNAITMLSFSLGGYFSYQLARAMGVDRLAALLAGFLFVASPYHLQRILGGSLELIAIQWLPLYLWMLMRALHRRTIRSALAAAAALLLTTLASQYYGLFFAVYSLAHGLLALLLTRTPIVRLRMASVGVLIGMVWAGVLLLFVWPPASLDRNVLTNWYDRQTYHSMSLIDLLAPNVQHPLWGDAATAWLRSIHPIGVEVGATFGLITTGLVLVAFWLRRAMWPWLLLVLLLVVLSLGPELKVGGQLSGIPLPFLLLDAAGPFRNASRPSLFVAHLSLLLALLAAVGLHALRQRFATRRLPVGVVLCGLVAFELLVQPWPVLVPQVAPAYLSMHDDPEPGAVLELPPLNDASQYMVNQLCHGRPLTGGYLARTPEFPATAYASAVRDVWDGREAQPDIARRDLANELASLGIRYVVLNLERMTPDRRWINRQQLAAPGLRLVQATPALEIYQVEQQTVQPAMFPVADALFAPEGDGRRTWRWMGERARLGLLVPSALPVEVSFEASAYTSPRRLQIFARTRLLAEVMVPAGSYTTLRLLLPPGTRELTLLSDTAATPEGRQVSLAISNVFARVVDGGPGPRVALLPTLPTWHGPPCK